MRERIKIKQAIVVEGKYDKIALENLFDTVIIETNGFNIFTDSEKLSYIKTLAETRGIIILTDSDSAGNKIRGYLTGSIDGKYITNAYIPEKKGRERRKAVPSKENLVGVEGMDAQIIMKALERSGYDKAETRTEKYSHADLYEMGLTGSDNSRSRRKKLLSQLNLPSNLSTSRLLKYLNSNADSPDLTKILQNINNQ